MKLDLDYKKIWADVIVTSLIIIICAISIISFIVISDQNVDIYNPSTKVAVSVGTERIQEVLSLIQSKYMGELDVEELTEGAIEGILSKIDDPYTRYLTAEEYKEETRSASEEYSGIGIHMIWKKKEEKLRIVSVMPDTPAKLIGLKSGDIILKVDDIEVTEDNMAKMSNLIKGEEGTTVKLTIDRGGKELKFDVTRAHITASNIEANLLDNIGYMRIISFDVDIYKQFHEEYTKLINKDGIKGLIIDLRDNPGGVVNDTIKIADLLVKDGIILKVQYADKTIKNYKANSTSCPVPVVILVNQNSASASEILAGAVKDLNQGTIIGTTTFGKGIMQTIIGLEKGDGLAVTTAKFCNASGKEIHGIGIEPDIYVELDEGVDLDSVAGTEKDNQLQEAIKYLNTAK